MNNVMIKLTIAELFHFLNHQLVNKKRGFPTQDLKFDHIQTLSADGFMSVDSKGRRWRIMKTEMLGRPVDHSNHIIYVRIKYKMPRRILRIYKFFNKLPYSSKPLRG